MNITYHKISYTEGTSARVESGIVGADVAARRVAVLKSRGMREVTATTYTEAGRAVPSVRPCPWSDRLAKTY